MKNSEFPSDRQSLFYTYCTATTAYPRPPNRPPPSPAAHTVLSQKQQNAVKLQATQ